MKVQPQAITVIKRCSSQRKADKIVFWGVYIQMAKKEINAKDNYLANTCIYTLQTGYNSPSTIIRCEKIHNIFLQFFFIYIQKDHRGMINEFKYTPVYIYEKVDNVNLILESCNKFILVRGFLS